MRINLPSPVVVRLKGGRTKTTAVRIADVAVDVPEMSGNKAPWAVSVGGALGGYGVRFVDGQFYVEARKVARGGSGIRNNDRKVDEGEFPPAIYSEILSKTAGHSLSSQEKTFLELYLNRRMNFSPDGEIVKTERSMDFEEAVRTIADDILIVDDVLHLRTHEPRICVTQYPVVEGRNHPLVGLFFGPAAFDAVVGYFGPEEIERKPLPLGSPDHARLFSCNEVEQAKSYLASRWPDRPDSLVLNWMSVSMPEVFTFKSSDDVLVRTVEFGVDALAPDLAFQDNATITAWMNCRDAVSAWKAEGSSVALEDCLDKDLTMIVSSLPKKQADELARCLDLCGERTMEFPSVISSSSNPGSRW